MLLSIIIPVYNTKNYILNCVDSVFKNQTRDFEIIIVNDGSTDGSRELCQQIQLKHPENIKLINQTNLGVSTARNKGIIESKGEYLIFLDSDDSLLPGVLDKIELNKKIDWHIFNYDSNDYLANVIKETKVWKVQDVSSYCEKVLYPYRNISNIPNANYTAPWPKIYKRNIIMNNQLIFPKNVKIGEDMLFNLQYLQYCKLIKVHTMKFYHQTFERKDSATHRKKFKKEQLENELMYHQEMKDIFFKYQFAKTKSYLYYDKLIGDFVNDYIDYNQSYLDPNEVRIAVNNASSNKDERKKVRVAKFVLNGNSILVNALLHSIRIIKNIFRPIVKLSRTLCKK
ncbi:putative glycosyltransferase EpsJ [Lactobacillus helveticus]|uniref:glycosyltransferase family 2 protein n=1 Tax=Lactobacillus helveticus TaxID=1587 RepID=UPI001563C4D1|nr:glycosyltransferase family 2 protein [Lactobacillus helveticus]NRO92065.1 putative glycosyltransferase EpsJ [Lactobacillus helveticus]